MASTSVTAAALVIKREGSMVSARNNFHAPGIRLLPYLQGSSSNAPTDFYKKNLTISPSGFWYV